MRARYRKTLDALIGDLVAIKREYSRLVFDEEDRMVLGSPATAEQLAKLEKRLSIQLPPSYRSFLELHDGWKHFDGGLDLLSVEDQHSDWVQDWLKQLEVVFTAVNEESPLLKTAFPVMLGEGEHVFLVLDLESIRPDGEMDLVQYNFAQIEQRYPDILAFLRHDLEVEKQVLERERKRR